jgi:hypothetical protein
MHEGCLWFCIFIESQTMSFFECVIDLMNTKNYKFYSLPKLLKVLWIPRACA